jgi:hypothetical protein
MAVRRTSVPERIAGDILGFTTGGEVEESQSVLAKYFPELSIRIPAKGARGGRLGRSTQMAEQEIKYTPQEMIRAGAPVTNISVTGPAQQQAPQGPDYTSQIEGLKQQLLGQSRQIEELLKGRTQTTQETKPTTETTKPFVPQTAEEQAKEQITNLYRNVLGREPEAEGLKSWMSEGRALGGITPEEYTSLERDFKLSPEYNVLKLYREELGRTEDPRKADPEGFKYWTTQDPRSGDRMITGQEYGELQQAFRASPEYQQKQQSARMAAVTPPATTGGTTASAPAAVSPPAPTRNFTPENPNPQTPEEAVKYLYQTQLGRTPSSEEAGYWLGNAAFADKGLSQEEWANLRTSFQMSPEYASLRR